MYPSSKTTDNSDGDRESDSNEACTATTSRIEPRQTTNFEETLETGAHGAQGIAPYGPQRDQNRIPGAVDWRRVEAVRRTCRLTPLCSERLAKPIPSLHAVDAAAPGPFVEPDLHLSPLEESLNGPDLRLRVDEVRSVAGHNLLDEIAQSGRLELVRRDLDASPIQDRAGRLTPSRTTRTISGVNGVFMLREFLPR